MLKPKVSVIIPVYNVEEYIVKCLNSVINQTLKDIEIICINDGSTDNSYAILKELAQQDDRIILINKENEGQGIARNIGIEQARGEYISFVDPDDTINPDMLKSMYEQGKNLNSDIVFCDILYLQEWSGKVWKYQFLQKAESSVKMVPISLPSGTNIDKKDIYQTLLVSPCYSCNRIYKTELLKSYNIKYSSIRCFEDVIFILKSYVVAERISYIDTPFYYYLLRKTSTLRSLKQRHLQLLSVIREIHDYISEKGLSDILALNFSYFVTMNALWGGWNSTQEVKKVFASELKKYLTKKDYRLFKKKLRLGSKFKNQIQKIISIRNKDNHKVFNFLGIKFKFKHFKGELKKEDLYIQKIKKNYNKFPSDSYILFDCLHDNTVENIDAYSLFLSMRKQNLNAYYVLLKDTPLYRHLEAENNLENIIPLENSSRECPGEFVKTIYEYLLKAKAVITSFGENSSKINKFFKDFPYWQYIFIQHGPTFLKESVMNKGYLYPEKFDKFLICSEQEKAIFNKYGWSDDKLICCGLPRWDLLNENEQVNEKSILMMFTWRDINILQFENSKYKHNLLKFLQNSELHDLLRKNNIKLYFANHHAFAANRGINFTIEDSENIKIIDNCEISKYIKQCSCLITDFSSVAFDFMFQDKPVLYYLLDFQDKNLNKYESKDLERFEYKKFIMPNVFYDEKDVINKLKFYIENNFAIEKENKNKYDKFFYEKEDIRSKLIEAIK